MKNKVLVVDDNFINRKLLYRILRDRFIVLEAENGKEALNIIDNNTDISAVLLDLMMPVMDGFEFLEHFSKRNYFLSIPVFVISASDTGTNKERALDLGVVDFISKPYNPVLIFKKINNILDLLQYQKELKIIGKDSLTGLCTMSAFKYYTDEILKNSNEKFYLVKLNINDFRVINSELGHEQGNKVLEFIGNRIKLFNDKMISGRAFGDRFLLFGSHEDFGDDPAYMKKQVENTLNALEKELNIIISVRLGVVEIYDCNISINNYIDQVTLACNFAGRNEKVNLNYYDKKIIVNEVYRKELFDKFGESLEKEYFEIYLQPKFNLGDLEIFGAEALVRWNHPEIGFITPGDFIPFLEERNLIDKLDYYVMEKVCQYLYMRKKNKEKLIPVSVNISRYDLNNELISDFNTLIKKYDIDKEFLHLEITESYANLGTEKMIEVTENLKSNGYFIELDDFGSGYSSLNVLSELKLDVIKLDIRFIKNLMNNPNVVKYVVNLADLMNYDLIIEGVETEEEKKLLLSLGCTMAQGYYCSKPLPIQEFNKLIN